MYIYICIYVCVLHIHVVNLVVRARTNNNITCSMLLLPLLTNAFIYTFSPTSTTTCGLCKACRVKGSKVETGTLTIQNKLCHCFSTRWCPCYAPFVRITNEKMESRLGGVELQDWRVGTYDHFPTLANSTKRHNQKPKCTYQQL